VPKILLGLGAACLLVAAVVFLAVTWSVMGVGGRTATLVGFTVVTGALAAWMARRDLRGAAEALSLVSLGLLAMDVFGARSANWLGDVGTPAFLVLLGLVLGAAGVGAALAARRAPVGGLTAPELVAGAGTGLLAAGVATLDAVDTAAGLVAAVILAGVATWSAHRARLLFTAAAAGLVTGGAWLAQLGHGLDAVSEATLGALWADFEAWQLLVSAALVSAVAALRDVPGAARVGAAAVGFGLLSFVVALPSFDESPTSVTLAGLVALAAAAAVGWLLPRPWGLVPVVTQAVAGTGMALVLLALGGAAVERLGEAAGAGWAGTPGGGLPEALFADLPAPWLAPLAVVALVGTLAVLAHAASASDAVPSAVTSAVTEVRIVAAILVASLVVMLACWPVPVWTVLLALLAAAAGFLAWWLLRGGAALLGLAAGFVLVGNLVSWYDEWLTVAALTATLLMAGVVHLRARAVETSAVAGAVASATVAGSVWTWGVLAQAPGEWVALVGLLLLAATSLTLHLYPDSWWAAEDAAWARAGVEVGAAAAAVPLGLVGVLTAPTSSGGLWASVYLTVAGAAVVVLSLLRQDRRVLTWPGGGLLVLASWVRLADLDVHAPEPYTLPAALVLVGVGLYRMRRDPSTGTMHTLAPGLTLALVPSLVWALDDPMTWRGLLLGLACLGLVMAGVRTRWSAPLVLGAAVGGVLVVRMAAPYIGEAVPRWVLIGAAGALLIATGVTWERRLQEARHMMGYVRALR
jgi:hypothetical protein